ncbi:MAG TPA: amidohydrolase [Pyrinomonadaceae bacterium]|nr:amidohydrolase [Pyrinomonadaceae bacterium]
MRIILALVLSLLALGLFAPGSNQQSADLVLKNGNIYTVNDREPRAEAVAIRGDRIVFTGSNADVKRYEGKGTRVIDLAGKTVVPGMTDAHYHLLGVGQREVTLNLEGTTSIEDFLARVRERVQKAKPGAWVTGRGWIETFWKPQRFPTRQELDTIAPNNPVYLVRADGHAAVANSAALKLSNVTAQTPNPFGGEVLKDKSTNEPTGMLIDAAKELVSKNIPGPTEADNEQATVLGVERSIRLGWTQIQDAGGSYDDVARLRKLYSEGRIKLRIYKAVSGPGPEADRLLKEGASVGAFNNRFTVRTIKIHFDGALGSRGAALLAPYSDAPETSGFLTEKEDEVAAMLEAALRRGIQVETHAIGDLTNRRILDLYEQAMAKVPVTQRGVREPRWRVEHAQIVTASDIPRFARLGIIPSMQPSHAIGDLFFAPKRLGMKRLEGAYAWQSFIKAGSIIAGGSDAPVERGEPMIEFYAAVARKSLKGESGEGWHPEQAVSREQALKMFTIWPAFAAFEETMKGSIEPGKLADLTILSADIMKIPEAEILQTRCMMTVIGGEVVYDAAK